jgi:hypothetical protein
MNITDKKKQIQMIRFGDDNDEHLTYESNKLSKEELDKLTESEQDKGEKPQ